MSYHTKWRRGITGALFLVAATAITSGCSDENLFGAVEKPEITSFTAASSTVAEGQTLSYQITAQGSRDIQRVRVSFSGAFAKDTVFAVDPPNTNISKTIQITVPMGTATPELQASATVTIADTVTSDPVTANVTVEDATPPTVSVSPGPASVGAGETIDVAVNAEDARGLQSIQVAVTDNAGYATTLDTTFATPITTFSGTLTMVAPAINYGALQFTPTATDINGLSSTGDMRAIQVGDQAGPEFVSLVTVPDSTVPLGDSVQVVVEVSDPSGIKQVTMIGLLDVGDPYQGTDRVIEYYEQKTIDFPRPTLGDTLPKTFTLRPFLFPVVDSVGVVEIMVVASDSLGNVSDTTTVVSVGGPSVSIGFPPDSLAVAVAADFDVRINVRDDTGIDSLKLYLGGIMDQVIDVPLPARTDTPMVLTPNVTVPASEGEVTIRAVAWNTREIAGRSLLKHVFVLASQPSDTTPPVVSVTAERLSPPQAAPRMELLDQIRITVSAYDVNAGLDQIRLSMVATRGTQKDTVVEIANFAASHNLERLVFQVPVDSLFALFGITDRATLDSIMPEQIDLRIHGFARDTVSGNVACSVGLEEQRPCTISGAARFAADHPGLPMRIEAVRGVTALLDNPFATIGDLAIDTVDDRLFLSNVTENLVEFLELDANPRNIFFHSPVQVGSEPLGLFMGERVVSASEPGFGGITVTPGDTLRTLLVANSGGTNLSLVHLEPNAANVQEVDVIRLQTPNSTLFEVEDGSDEFGNAQYTVTYIDLADRPQFLAQDSLLRIVYSTRPTAASRITTVRFVHADPDPTSTTDVPEVEFMITDAMVDESNQNRLALANIDDIQVVEHTSAPDEVVVVTHEPGYPNNPLVSAPSVDLGAAVADIITQIDAIMTARGIPGQAPMFYPYISRGTWDLTELSWGDTTFVSASGDRGKIALGEGATSPTGRIMMWNADERATYSNAVQMTDLVNNAAEVVLGVGLNQNGSLGVARGNEATYFFTPDLRLQGLYSQADVGGSGATFHPDHDAVSDGGHTDPTGAGVAFTGTSNHSIDVVNTFHFNEVNNLVIRDDIVGPLRAGPPLASDNNGQGAQCVALNTEPAVRDCIVAKLYGITSAGGVVILNVRRRDLEPYATP